MTADRRLLIEENELSRVIRSVCPGSLASR